MTEIIEYSPEYEPWFCFVDNVGFSGFDSPYTNDLPTERYPEGYVQTFLAKEDGLVVGYISLSDECSFGMDWSGRKYAEINGIAVLPPYRSRGIGHQLLYAAADWCEEHGYEKVYAFVTCSARYDLHSFYEDAGFRRESIQLALNITGKREQVQMPAESYWNYHLGIERQKHTDHSRQPHNHLPPHSIGWVGFVYCLNLVPNQGQLELL